jgi:hypothetical protein
VFDADNLRELRQRARLHLVGRNDDLHRNRDALCEPVDRGRVRGRESLHLDHVGLG